MRLSAPIALAAKRNPFATKSLPFSWMGLVEPLYAYWITQHLFIFPARSSQSMTIEAKKRTDYHNLVLTVFTGLVIPSYIGLVAKQSSWMVYVSTALDYRVEPISLVLLWIGRKIAKHDSFHTKHWLTYANRKYVLGWDLPRIMPPEFGFMTEIVLDCVAAHLLKS